MARITSVRLDDDLRGKLETLAVSVERSMTWLIEQAVRRYVAEESWQVAAIREAVEALHSGAEEMSPHEEVMRRIEAKLPPEPKP